MRILKILPPLLVLLLCALPACADSVYNISGALTIIGNTGPCGALPCVETLAFSFDLEYEPPGPPYLPVILPGASVTSFGPLAPFSAGNVQPYYLAFGNTAGDEIDIVPSTSFLRTTEGPPPPLFGPELYSCNLSNPDPICVADFSNEGVPCCNVDGVGDLQYTVTFLPSATVPEASTLAYLLLGLGLFLTFLWRLVRPQTSVGFQRGCRMTVSGCRFVPKTDAAKKRLLPFLEAVEDEFHASRNAQFIEYAKQVIPHDLLLAQGRSPLQVTLFCYLIAIVFAGISWKERGMSPVEASAVSALSFAALAVIEVRLGSLRLEQNARPPIVSVRGASNKSVPAP